MSSDLVWQITRNNSCFLRKTRSNLGGYQFSVEKGNLMNVNSYKYSGLANQKTVDVRLGSGVGEKQKNGVTVITVNDGSKTAKTVEKKHDPKRINKAIATSGKKVRGDLLRAARARFSRVTQAEHVSAARLTQRKARKTRAAKKTTPQ